MKIHLTDRTVQTIGAGTYFDTKTPAFGLRVGKHRRTWIVTKGQRRAVITLGHYPSLGLADARRKALVALGSPLAPAASVSFPDALDAFLGQSHWKASTRYTVEKCLRKHFAFTKALDKITHQEIAAVIDELSPGAAGEATKNIRAFFTWAVPRHLSASPCVGLKPPTYRPKQRVLADDEIVKVWNAAAGTYGRLVKLLLLCGQRRGELATLTRNQVRDDRIVLYETKNGREHTFPLGEMAGEILGPLPSSRDALLFPALGKPTSPFSAWSKSLKALHEKSQTNGWSLHDLRRTFATGLASLGVPIHVTEKLLNHVSGTTGGIVGVYQRHEYWDEQVAAVKLWEAHLAKLLRLSDAGE